MATSVDDVISKLQVPDHNFLEPPKSVVNSDIFVYDTGKFTFATTFYAVNAKIPISPELLDLLRQVQLMAWLNRRSLWDELFW